jgi:hypothetical protein
MESRKDLDERDDHSAGDASFCPSAWPSPHKRGEGIRAALAADADVP